MNKEELKSEILENLNLDPFRKAMIERFFSQKDVITEADFNQLYIEWCNSDDGKKAAAEIQKSLDKDKDYLIQIGLSSIKRKDYHLVNKFLEPRFGALIVVDNSTRLRGLLSENEEEILPCIFDHVDVKLDGLIEVYFKEKKYKFIILSQDYIPNDDFDDYVFNGTIWYYLLDKKTIKNYKNTGREYSYVELDETTDQLISLLNVKHSTKERQ